MSVINQVLNQLERRGAHGTPEQVLIRAVPESRRNHTLTLLLIGLALASGIATWQWIQRNKQDIAAKSSIPLVGNHANPANPIAALDTPLSSPQAAVPQVAPDRAGMFVPASRMSLELSLVPLPSLQDRKAAPRKPAAQSAKPSPDKVKAAVRSGESPLKQISPAQRADAEFRKAVTLMQQGRISDALAGFESALRLDGGHDAARQALVALLLENRRGEEAERVLLDRLKVRPEQYEFTMMLARLQVDRGALDEATSTLEKSLRFADTQADYRAFLAALLQRQNRHEEAITQYRIVTQLAPGNGVWLMGYGISLQAVQRNSEAKEAFKKAFDTQTLSPDLQAFVQQKLKEL